MMDDLIGKTNPPQFKSIRAIASEGFLSEYALRSMLRRGELPGIYSGKKFLVNYKKLLEKLNDSTERSGKSEKK